MIKLNWLRAITATLALFGFLSAANATSLAPAEQVPLVEDQQITSQYIFEKYLFKARHRCYRRRYAISRDCCAFDYYGNCRKWCTHYGYRNVCPRHKRYRKKRRRYRGPVIQIY